MFKKQAETIFSRCRDLVNGIKWFVGSDEEWNDYWAQRQPNSSDSSREKSEENVQDESKGCSSRDNFHAHKMNQYRAHNRMPTQASSDESEDDFQVNQMKKYQSSNYGVPNTQASTDDNDMQSLLELLSNDNFEGAVDRETSFETLVGSSWDDSQTSIGDNQSSDEKRDENMPLNVISVASENREESLVASDGKIEDEMTPHCTFGSSGKIEHEKTPHHTFGSVAKSSAESHVPITSQSSQVQSPDFHLKTLVEMLENDKFLAKKQQLKSSGSITAIESFDSNFGSGCEYQHVVGVKSESDGENDETFKMFSFRKSAKFWNEAQNGSEGVSESENDSLSMLNKLIARFNGHDEISLHLNIVKDLVLKIEQEGWKKSDELDDQNENEADVDYKTEENPNDETNETLKDDPDDKNAETLDGDDAIEEEFFTEHLDKFGTIFKTLDDARKSFRKVKGYRCWKYFCLEEGCEEADTEMNAEQACEHRTSAHTGQPIAPESFLMAIIKISKDEDTNNYECAFCDFSHGKWTEMRKHLRQEMRLKMGDTPDIPKMMKMLKKLDKTHFLK